MSDNRANEALVEPGRTWLVENVPIEEINEDLADHGDLNSSEVLASVAVHYSGGIDAFDRDHS